MSPRRFSRSRISRTRCSRAISRTGQRELPKDSTGASAFLPALLKRRHFLLSGAALAGAASFAAWLPGTGSRFWPEQGFWNPCRAALPWPLAHHELVTAAWEGLDPQRVWDCHAHLAGIGDSASGIFVHPKMNSLLNPAHYARRLFFLNAGCAYDDPGGSVDRAYVRRLLALMDGMRRGAKLLLFAFERVYSEEGKRQDALTSFHVPDAYARAVAAANPQVFEWVASIHPYRADCGEALAEAKRAGARAVKWLPGAMGMDPASPRCDRFYEAAVRLKLPIISHAGEERAVPGADTQDFGNPLRLRRALDAGVRVVVAHCASLGQDRDLDKGTHGPLVDSFLLFERLMQEKKYEKNLFGDISAMTQVNRAGPTLAKVIEREEWHPRLLNGSDYPLPGVMPITSVSYLVSLGLVQESAAPVLQEIRAHNPLLFDLALKRQLRSKGRALSKSIFETRSFFENH
ncbi:MAG: amidohydrolase [Betaproteobacteria bacterium]|nr:amidohydrolase [Betaproteobacteria bacterium]